MYPFLNAPVHQWIMLLTDENYGCNYVGVRVLVSRGNVFCFVYFVFIYGLNEECSRWGTVYFMQVYFVFHMRELYLDITIDLDVDRGIYVRRHGQNSDPKGIEREEAQ